MSTAAIWIGFFALLGWGSLVEAVKAVLVARARAACPCRDLTSLHVELPEIRTRFSVEGSEAVKDGFEAARWKGH